MNSWGFLDVLPAWAYRSGGLPAIAPRRAVLASPAAGLVLLVARRLGAGPLAATVSRRPGVAPGPADLPLGAPRLVDYCVIPVLVLLHAGDPPPPRLPARLVGPGALATVVNLHSTAVGECRCWPRRRRHGGMAPRRPRTGRLALRSSTLGVMVNPGRPADPRPSGSPSRGADRTHHGVVAPRLTSPAVVAGLAAAAAAAVVTPDASRDPLLFPLLALPAGLAGLGPDAAGRGAALPPPFFPRPGSPRLVLPERPSRTRCQRSRRSSSRGAAGAPLSRSRWPGAPLLAAAARPAGLGGGPATYRPWP